MKSCLGLVVVFVVAPLLLYLWFGISQYRGVAAVCGAKPGMTVNELVELGRKAGVDEERLRGPRNKPGEKYTVVLPTLITVGEESCILEHDGEKVASVRWSGPPTPEEMQAAAAREAAAVPEKPAELVPELPAAPPRAAPSDAVVQALALAQKRFDLNDREGALAILGDAFAARPDHPLFERVNPTIMSRLKRRRLAGVLGTAPRPAPRGEAERLYERARTAHREGRGAEAIGLYREALRLRPRYADASLGLTTALVEMAYGDSALIAIDEALARDPNNFRLHDMRRSLFGR